MIAWMQRSKSHVHPRSNRHVCDRVLAVLALVCELVGLKMRHCQFCGCSLPEKLLIEVKMSKIQWTILDALRRAGDNGLEADTLQDRVYGDRAVNPETLKAHIWRLRKSLKGTHLSVESWGWGRREGYRATYRLVRGT